MIVRKLLTVQYYLLFPQCLKHWLYKSQHSQHLEIQLIKLNWTPSVDWVWSSLANVRVWFPYQLNSTGQTEPNLTKKTFVMLKLLKPQTFRNQNFNWVWLSNYFHVSVILFDWQTQSNSIHGFHLIQFDWGSTDFTQDKFSLQYYLT